MSTFGSHHGDSVIFLLFESLFIDVNFIEDAAARVELCVVSLQERRQIASLIDFFHCNDIRIVINFTPPTLSAIGLKVVKDDADLNCNLLSVGSALRSPSEGNCCLLFE